VNTYSINGTVHHRMGPLQARAGQPPKFAQIFILDGFQEQLEARMNIMGRGLSRDTMSQLQQMLDRHNPYVRSIKVAGRVFREAAAAAPGGAIPDIRMILRAEGGNDQRRYNLATVPEIAAFMPDGVNPEVRPYFCSWGGSV
jgi:hypothetical protein